MTTYTTKDFYLTAFLVASGHPLQAHDRNGNVSTFMFSATDKLSWLVERYYDFQASINPVTYANAFRNLKSVMYSTSTITNDNKYLFHQSKGSN